MRPKIESLSMSKSPTHPIHPTNLDNALGLLQKPVVPTWLGMQEFSELVACIYRGTLEDPPWISVLTRLREVLQAHPVALVLRAAAPHQRAIIVIAREDNPGLAMDDFTLHDELDMDIFSRLAEDRVMAVDELCGEKTWLESDFYRTWVEPFNIRYMLGAQIRGEDGSLCRLRIGRPPDGLPFTDREKAICQALVPHFKQAMAIFSRMNALETEQHFYAEAVNRLFLGTILMDGDARVMRMNGIAEKIVAERDGLSFSSSGLMVEDRDAQHALRAAIAHGLAVVLGSQAFVSEDFAEAITVPRPSGRMPLLIRIHPLPQNEVEGDDRRAALALLVHNPEQKFQLAPKLLQRLFGLTPAESALAQRLVEGLSLDAAAARLGIRKNTARAQLSAIFAKTGVARQSSLVSLLLTSSEFL